MQTISYIVLMVMFVVFVIRGVRHIYLHSVGPMLHFGSEIIIFPNILATSYIPDNKTCVCGSCVATASILRV